MSQKKSIWVTYAWDDNVDGDVDFAAQELRNAGLEVKLDRWNLTAGKPLWGQIESFVQHPSESDGWLLYATQASLGSEACKEEYRYALDRALENRGEDFPVIALFAAPVDRDLIPAGIRTRLYVGLTDPDWKERIVAAVERRQLTITRPQVEPYALTVHELPKQCGDKRYAVEVRPRAGAWAPFFAAIPLNEKEQVSPDLYHGPARRTPMTGPVFSIILFDRREGPSAGRWVLSARNEATPTQSYYVLCRKLPSLLSFGVYEGQPQYHVTF